MGGLAATLYKKREQQQVPFQFKQIESMFLFFYNNVEDSKTSRNMCEDLLGYSHKQAKQ